MSFVDRNLPRTPREHWLEASAHSCVRLRCHYAPHFLSLDGEHLFVSMRNRITSLSSPSEHLRTAIKALGDGLSWCDLKETLPEADLIQVARLIERATRIGALSYDVMDGSVRLATFVPQVPNWRPPTTCIEQYNELHLSRLTRIVHDDGAWHLQCPVSGILIELHDEGLRKWLVADALEMALSSKGIPKLLVHWLVKAGALFSESSASESYPLWEPDDWAFHIKSRAGRLSVRRGRRTEPLPGTTPGPARRPAWAGAVLAPPLISRPKMPLAEALATRRSDRWLGEHEALIFDVLASILTMATECQGSGIGSFDMEVSIRPYPSAGGCHPLEFYVASATCQGLPPGFWHFRPDTGDFVQVSRLTHTVEALIRQAQISMEMSEPPGAVIVVGARFARSFYKYEKIAYANILREVGAFYQTLYLAATAYGCAACAVGVGNIQYFSQITGLSPFEEGTVGEICVNGAPLQ